MGARKKDSAAKVKRDLKAINSKLTAMYIDKLAHGGNSKVPLTGIKLHNMLDDITKAMNRIK
tara:strand:- start:238 stop:423 length:186 start_codon:yes stop_codon:yes gene_type:complete